MQAKTISGYGVDITGMDFETPVFLKFVKDHAPAIYNDYFLDIPDDCIFPDVIIKLQDYKADGVFDYGYGAIITEIIRNETGIAFDYSIGEFEGMFIFYPKRMPWEMTEQEKSLTGEKICDILQPYFTELGINNISCEYFSVRYYS